ncbi:hypothetical protein Ocin01_04844 [Orchesella cincta]|uniref:Extradiol ring-cleavage dioxygenase class III enzyme subunit B domain-containing protein n=1 Tax=Orchesella cincta TaxID=48709 RepID=A0A1D2N999_ORCCI|nr:hypothetical protein Ocin01_04844 [Orchesella cincta]
MTLSRNLFIYFGIQQTTYSKSEVIVAVKGHAIVQNMDADTQNPFVGFYVFPHGGITLDPQGSDYSNEPAWQESSQEKCVELHNAMRQAAEALVQSQPDLIIFSTPHGFRLADNVQLLYNTKVAGDAGERWSNFTASFDIDPVLPAVLYEALKSTGRPVQSLTMGKGSETLPITWGEVIPWYFILEAASKAGFPVPSAVYIGPSKNVSIDNLRNIGRDITKTVLHREEFANRKIAVVISGDLSHYHSNDPSSPYPYSPFAEVFDKYVVNWAKMDRNAETENSSAYEILEKAGSLSGRAGTCGYTGLVMLHGMMEELVLREWNFTSHFYTYQTPTYYGMTVASWLPEVK